MGIIARRQSGFIFSDSFDSLQLDPRWEIAPGDPSRWSLTEQEGALRLKHGASPVYAFINDLTATKQFVLDVKNIYNPTVDGDVGGIIVYSSDSDYLTLDEYFDAAKGTSQSYNWLRLIRNYNTYYGYWSNDGMTWNPLGAQEFDSQSPRIGLFLWGAAGQNFDIEEVRISTGTTLTIDDIRPGQKIDLLDSEGDILETLVGRSNTPKLEFHLERYPIPLFARLGIAGVSGVNSETVYTFWGGDVFAINYAINLEFEDEDGNRLPLEENIEAFLGFMNVGVVAERPVKMYAVNDFTTGTFTDVQIAMADYNETGQYSRIVSLAEDVSGSPGQHLQAISLANIAAGGEKIFWVILSREMDPSKLRSEVYFGLTVNATFN